MTQKKWITRQTYWKASSSSVMTLLASQLNCISLTWKNGGYFEQKLHKRFNGNKSCVDCRVAMVVSICHFNSKFAKNKLQSV